MGWRKMEHKGKTRLVLSRTVGVLVVGRAGRNTRGSLARSVHGQLGSARIDSFDFFHELS
jgi:hypothetical protein